MRPLNSRRLRRISMSYNYWTRLTHCTLGLKSASNKRDRQYLFPTSRPAYPQHEVAQSSRSLTTASLCQDRVKRAQFYTIGTRLSNLHMRIMHSTNQLFHLFGLPPSCTGVCCCTYMCTQAFGLPNSSYSLMLGAFYPFLWYRANKHSEVMELTIRQIMNHYPIYLGEFQTSSITFQVTGRCAPAEWGLLFRCTEYVSLINVQAWMRQGSEEDYESACADQSYLRYFEN
jgi:hypothetical protein